jgi:MOSC domain-containing protein YiiM
MRLESVNRSRPRTLTLLGRERVTGIAKEPTTGPVTVGPDGLDGDGVGNPTDHGGVDQALYLYGLDEYRWWAGEAGLDVVPGLFGENLTVSELASASVEVGDRLAVGPVVLEVTAPRIACATLSGRVGDGGFAARFAEARRPGAYARVLTGGPLQAGADIVATAGGSGVTLLDCVAAYYDPATPSAEVERLLASPLASRFRTMLERRLATGQPA